MTNTKTDCGRWMSATRILVRNWDLAVGCLAVGLVMWAGSEARKITMVQRIGTSVLSSNTFWTTSEVVSVVWYGPPWKPVVTYRTNTLETWRQAANPFEPQW